MRQLPGSKVGVLGCWLLFTSIASAEDAALREPASKALHKAVDAFRKQVATEGGYLWRYSEDLTRREGERARRRPAWSGCSRRERRRSVWRTCTPIRPPATVTTWRPPAKPPCALVEGSAALGRLGLLHRVRSRQKRKRIAYRADGDHEASSNVTTLDDNTTQAALRLLMRVDQALEFKDAKIHEAAEYGLTSSPQGQYPNGAWPQRFDQLPRAGEVSGQEGELSRDLVADSSRQRLSRLLHLQRQQHGRRDRRDVRGGPDVRRAEVPGGGREAPAASSSWPRCPSRSRPGPSSTTSTCTRPGRASSSRQRSPAANRRACCAP